MKLNVLRVLLSVQELLIPLDTRVELGRREDIVRVRVVGPRCTDVIHGVLVVDRLLNTLEVLDDLESKAHGVVPTNVTVHKPKELGKVVSMYLDDDEFCLTYQTPGLLV